MRSLVYDEMHRWNGEENKLRESMTEDATRVLKQRNKETEGKEGWGGIKRHKIEEIINERNRKKEYERIKTLVNTNGMYNSTVCSYSFYYLAPTCFGIVSFFGEIRYKLHINLPQYVVYN